MIFRFWAAYRAFLQRRSSRTQSEYLPTRRRVLLSNSTEDNAPSQHATDNDFVGRFISGYITGNSHRHLKLTMPSSQQRAIQNYRARLAEKGLMRFEVLGRRTDRELIRSLAKRLAENDPQVQEVRATLEKSMAGQRPTSGGILAALRTSPLVGANIDFNRSREFGRRVKL